MPEPDIRSPYFTRERERDKETYRDIQRYTETYRDIQRHTYIGRD